MAAEATSATDPTGGDVVLFLGKDGRPSRDLGPRRGSGGRGFWRGRAAGRLGLFWALRTSGPLAKEDCLGPSLFYGTRVAKLRALVPGRRVGLWSQVFPVPAEWVCLRQEEVPCQLLETPPECPCPLPHVWGKTREAWMG